MPRHRTPSNVLELKGAYKRNPSRRRKSIRPVDQDIGAPPAHLTPKQAETWKETVQIAPPNVLKATDRLAMEVMACLISEFREAPALFTSARITQLVSLLSRFGMTPADREKISVDQGPTVPDQFREFL